IPLYVWHELGALALFAAGIGVIWCWISVSWREPTFLIAGQGGFIVAVLLAVTAVLRAQGWVEDQFAALLTPHSLHAYGVALCALVLPAALARAWRGANSPLLLDRGVRHVVLIGQLALVICCLVPPFASD